jgi:serine/threonine protein kinase
MGEVYLARHRGPDGFEKLVVLKTLLPHLSENDELLAMFKDEARLSARLIHPNICQTFEFDQADGTWYIAMEYLRGDDLRNLTRACDAQGQPIPAPLACRIVADAAAGLDFAHALRDETGHRFAIVHRDISPQNVFVTFSGGVKLIDFGVAKAAGGTHHTGTGALKGKFAYMSPEQVAGVPLDGRSDIFALGIVLHELLTRRRLFKAESDLETLANVRACNVPAPSAIDPRLPRALDDIVLTALAKDREHRYRTAQQLRLGLEQWLVDSRMSASSAHLEEFLQRVYGERLDPETDPERTPATSPAKELRARARTSSGLVRSRARAAAIGAAAVAALGVAAVARFTARPVAPPALAPASAAPQQAAPNVRVQVETVPPGAQIREGPTLVGISPAFWETTPGEHQLTFTLQGYRESTATVIVAEGSRYVVALARVRAEARRPARDPALKVER